MPARRYLPLQRCFGVRLRDRDSSATLHWPPSPVLPESSPSRSVWRAGERCPDRRHLRMVSPRYYVREVRDALYPGSTSVASLGGSMSMLESLHKSAALSSHRGVLVTTIGSNCVSHLPLQSVIYGWTTRPLPRTTPRDPPTAVSDALQSCFSQLTFFSPSFWPPSPRCRGKHTRSATRRRVRNVPLRRGEPELTGCPRKVPAQPRSPILVILRRLH